MVRAGAFLLLWLLLLPTATAELVPNPEGDFAASDGLSGRDIYDRVIAHRLRSFYLEASLLSRSGQGDSWGISFRMVWKDFRREDGDTLSKAKIELEQPFAIRFGGVQIERNADGRTEQWAYASVLRRTFRVNLRGVNIHGSDFAFDDVIPPEAEDFHYRRLADAVYDGKPVYVVELFPRANSPPSDHSRIVVSIDKARDVVLRARYWDGAGDEVRELAIPPASLEEFDGSWFPMLATMRDLRTGSFSRLEISRFVANLELGPRVFDLGRLESH